MVKNDLSNMAPLMQNIQHHLQSKNQTETKLSDTMKELSLFFEADMAISYISIDDNYLELFSNYGFDASDETTNIRYGEGFIGEIALKSSVLSKTEDEGYVKSIIGAPLLQWEKVTGVILLGYLKEHRFTDSEVNALKTIAMFLATAFSSEEISDYKRKLAKSRGFTLKDRLKGAVINKGYGVGFALVHRRRRAIKQMFAKDISKELLLLDKARNQMLQSLDDNLKTNTFGAGEHVEILETYKLLANDKGWHKKIKAQIETGLTAEAAIEKTYEDMFEKLSATSDIYLKERLNDFRDLSDRLRTFLSGEKNAGKDAAKDIILVAQSMGPADLMDYDYKKIRALILEDGTSTMHVALVAKALNIPVVSQIKGIYRNVKDGETLAVDGVEGYVYINPTDDMKKDFKERGQKMANWREDLKSLSSKKAVTSDGVKISLNINVGLDFDLEYIGLSNCDGVGLYRTEIPFMSADSLPTVSKQVKIYQKLLKEAKNKKVVFRSLDVGSDKLLPYWGDFKEENPAIGWRSIRITLDRRALLRSQMKALLKAAAGRELDVMFPMISSYHEFMEAKKTLLLEYEKQKKNGEKLPSKLNIGLMIEVPSGMFELDEILKEADFISVGTNDLAQFVFACDRTNPRLADRYDVLSAPFLKVMKIIAQKAKEHHVLCGVCGEMASVPVEAMALLGLGYTRLSSTGSSFASIKKMVRTANISEITDYVENLLRSNQKTLRPQLFAYAYDHGIAI
ncbi:MAG: phosphoenolpyruvate--protein phosphotransferase [Alphaproteobacteria bacterium]|nr:phosphoenolpyruvate--protein phosphotransferase [Alphaproteobacteria bacterium]